MIIKCIPGFLHLEFENHLELIKTSSFEVFLEKV